MIQNQIQLAADGEIPKPKAFLTCALVMREMLDLGWSKDDLPELERIFWTVRDSRGKVYKPKS